MPVAAQLHAISLGSRLQRSSIHAELALLAQAKGSRIGVYVGVDGTHLAAAAGYARILVTQLTLLVDGRMVVCRRVGSTNILRFLAAQIALE